MDLCSKACSSVLSPSVCSSSMAKTLMLDTVHKLFNQIFVTPSMFMGIVDFYHLKLLSMTLTSAEGHKVNSKQNLLASFSSIHYN